MEKELSHLITQIKPVSSAWLAKAKERLDSLTKPPGSLGRLEELAVRYVCIREELLPALKKKRVVVFAGDHGVVAEGVSAYPKEVTSQMVLNFLRGGAGVNVLARHCRTRVIVVDMPQVGQAAGRDVPLGQRPRRQLVATQMIDQRHRAIRAHLRKQRHLGIGRAAPDQQGHQASS